MQVQSQRATEGKYIWNGIFFEKRQWERVEQMDKQHGLIWKLMFYNSELGQYTTKATKNIWCKQLITVEWPVGWRNFAWVART